MEYASNSLLRPEAENRPCRLTQISYRARNASYFRAKVDKACAYGVHVLAKMQFSHCLLVIYCIGQWPSQLARLAYV
jgi:hypothetical protein